MEDSEVTEWRDEAPLHVDGDEEDEEEQVASAVHLISLLEAKNFR